MDRGTLTSYARAPIGNALPGSKLGKEAEPVKRFQTRRSAPRSSIRPPRNCLSKVGNWTASRGPEVPRTTYLTPKTFGASKACRERCFGLRFGLLIRPNFHELGVQTRASISASKTRRRISGKRRDSARPFERASRLGVRESGCQEMGRQIRSVRWCPEALTALRKGPIRCGEDVDENECGKRFSRGSFRSKEGKLSLHWTTFVFSNA